MFVQEFVRIEAPLRDVIVAFEDAVLPRFGDLLRDAWDGQGLETPVPYVPTAIGSRRDRDDGVAYAVSWPATVPLFPAFDADIELAEVADRVTHLEFAGLTHNPAVEPWSAEDRRVNRQSMVAIDRLLRSIATMVECQLKSLR